MASTSLGAQSGPFATPGRHAVVLGVGVEPALVLVLGYQRRVGARAGGVRLGAGLTLPTTALDRGAWRADVRAARDPLGRGAWQVPIVAGGYVVRNRNAAGSMLGVGAEVRAAPGRYGARGGLGVDLGWQVTAATRVRHSAPARATFGDRHPDGAADGATGPRDGWYRLSAQRYRMGVAGRRVLGRPGAPAALWAAGGATFVRQRQGVLVAFDLGQVPLYAETGVRVAW